MELKDFISNTLISIKNGLADANSQTNNSFVIRQAQEVITFDVAIEVGKENTTEKGGGLRIHVVEGKLSGTSKTKESSISRILFAVGLKRQME
jgi:hypothetical protein